MTYPVATTCRAGRISQSVFGKTTGGLLQKEFMKVAKQLVVVVVIDATDWLYAMGILQTRS